MHPEKLREYMKKYYSKFGSYRTRLLNILGDKCVSCGFQDIRALQIDHINGGSYKEKKIFKQTNTMYTYYCNHPEEAKQKLQILCANCNWIKRYEKSENGGYVR